jgi:hypothetical protein
MRKDISQSMSDMELRITKNLAEMLARKADLVMHQELEARVRGLERDAILRTGPAWGEHRAWVQEIENLLTQHDRLVPEFRTLQERVRLNTERIKSDAELKTMMRDERGMASGAQWSTVSKLILIITTLVAILGLWLAWNRSQNEPAAMKGSVANVSSISYSHPG